MLGYWRDEEKTAEAVDADGWMHTGDLAVMRSDGYCNIVGRIKDLVIRGGENIYPARSRNSCTPIPTSRMPRSSVCPMRSTAKNSARGCGCARIARRWMRPRS